ncbi:MAG: hypothetical protein IBX72_14530 [Nitrospirae bacterium]|nr:hypothetical protein [Nitrospirota bacterium]
MKTFKKYKSIKGPCLRVGHDGKNLYIPLNLQPGTYYGAIEFIDKDGVVKGYCAISELLEGRDLKPGLS